MVIVDEAHHATSAAHRAILDRFTSAHVLGVTATPDRLDGRGLGEIFASVALRYELREAIADGFLAPIVAQRVAIESVRLETVRTIAGDFDRGQLSKVMNADPAVQGIAKATLDLVGDRKTIVFGVDVAHAHALAAEMNTRRSGVAHAIDGSASEFDRKTTLADFETGVFQVLVNCALLVEGFDSPSVACVAIARPTKSRALFCQMIGRGTRLAPGKADCLILDFTGNAGRHRLIGPADCLAGDEVLPEEIRAELEALLATGTSDVRVALDLATARANEIAQRAIVTYAATEIDPFVGDLGDEIPRDLAWSSDLATEAQRAALAKLGLGDLPARLSRGEAGRWITGLHARRARGLCSLRQARWLTRHGRKDVQQMTASDASELIGESLERLERIRAHVAEHAKPRSERVSP